MKIMETATFKFCFKEVKTKDESYKVLKQFLTENDWLDEFGNKKLPLNSYHSNSLGECEIILAEANTSEEYINLIDELFESIISRHDIKWVTTYYNENTFNIVHKEGGKYLKQQKVDLSDMKNGDEICVYFRKK